MLHVPLLTPCSARRYLLGSSTALAVFAYLDPVEW